MPEVLNKRNLSKTLPADSVYVGRPSKWGNPFEIGKDGTREEVVEKYVQWLPEMLATTGSDLEELRGKSLVCWCSPLPCHADVLLEGANV